jgi:hypothetical protein
VGTKLVSLGAIVGVRTDRGSPSESATSSATLAGTGKNLFAAPLACLDCAGRSAAERMIGRFVAAGAEVSVLIETDQGYRVPESWTASGTVTIEMVSDVASAIAEKLAEYASKGVEHSFVTFADAYTETDLLDLFHFHRESRKHVTRASDRDGALPLWVVDCATAPQSFDISQDMMRNDESSYFIREYVRRLVHPRDLRRLAADALSGNCELRPAGQEVRPGVWLGEGAEIHKKARIVAPAYIGCGARVFDDTLITRSSSIERGSFIDCGTVVENSSVLPETHVGIWLDVRHAVVAGNRLVNLARDVTVEISDPAVLCSTTAPRRATTGILGRSERNDNKVNATDFEEQHPRLSNWQFGVDLIQE